MSRVSISHRADILALHLVTVATKQLIKECFVLLSFGKSAGAYSLKRNGRHHFLCELSWIRIKEGVNTTAHYFVEEVIKYKTSHTSMWSLSSCSFTFYSFSCTQVPFNIVSIILVNYLVEIFYTYYLEMSKFPDLNFVFVQILLRQ